MFKFRSIPFLVQMTRRTSPEELAFANGKIMTTRRNQISQGTGTYKDYDLRITCQWVESVEAYAVGDLAAVGVLLKQVSAIGKLTRNGWGTISDMKIEPDDEALEKWRYRTLPSVLMEQSGTILALVVSGHRIGGASRGSQYGNLPGFW